MRKNLRMAYGLPGLPTVSEIAFMAGEFAWADNGKSQNSEGQDRDYQSTNACRREASSGEDLDVLTLPGHPIVLR